MLILAIDTSTAMGSVALRNDSQLIGAISTSVALTHSEGLMPAIDALMQRTGCSIADVEGVACVSGPGSFTGLRVGMASAQGIAMARGLPCVTCTSMELLARGVPQANAPLCPLMPARKGWLYAQFFTSAHPAPQPLSEEKQLTMEALVAEIHQPTILFGPGLTGYREAWREILGADFLELPQAFDVLRADLLAEYALTEIQAGRTLHPAQLQPHYLAPSQAEAKRFEQAAST